MHIDISARAGPASTTMLFTHPISALILSTLVTGLPQDQSIDWHELPDFSTLPGVGKDPNLSPRDGKSSLPAGQPRSWSFPNSKKDPQVHSRRDESHGFQAIPHQHGSEDTDPSGRKYPRSVSPIVVGGDSPPDSSGTGARQPKSGPSTSNNDTETGGENGIPRFPPSGDPTNGDSPILPHEDMSNDRPSSGRQQHGFEPGSSLPPSGEFDGTSTGPQMAGGSAMQAREDAPLFHQPFNSTDKPSGSFNPGANGPQDFPAVGGPRLGVRDDNEDKNNPKTGITGPIPRQSTPPSKDTQAWNPRLNTRDDDDDQKKKPPHSQSPPAAPIPNKPKPSNVSTPGSPPEVGSPPKAGSSSIAARDDVHRPKLPHLSREGPVEPLHPREIGPERLQAYGKSRLSIRDNEERKPHSGPPREPGEGKKGHHEKRSQETEPYNTFDPASSDSPHGFPAANLSRLDARDGTGKKPDSHGKHPSEDKGKPHEERSQETEPHNTLNPTNSEDPHEFTATDYSDLDPRDDPTKKSHSNGKHPSEYKAPPNERRSPQNRLLGAAGADDPLLFSTPDANSPACAYCAYGNCPPVTHDAAGKVNGGCPDFCYCLTPPPKPDAPTPSPPASTNTSTPYDPASNPAPGY